MSTQTNPLDNPSREAFEEAMRQLLRESGMTQTELARRTGIPYTTLNRRFVGGKGRCWLVSEIAEVCHVWGVSWASPIERTSLIESQQSPAVCV